MNRHSSFLVALLAVVFAYVPFPRMALCQEAAHPPDHTAAAHPPPTSSTEDPREIIRRALQNDEINDRKARSYTYLQREEQRKLDSQGQTRSVRSETSEIMVLYGQQVARPIARNDKPLPAKDAAKEESRINRIIAKREKETPDERQKRLAQEEKDRQETRAFVQEVNDAYNFRLQGLEQVNGREAFVISGEPNPQFHPRHRDAKYLSKFRIRVWIDKAEYQWVKLDAEAIDTISWGLFIARIYPGSRIELEQARVRDEVWLPSHQHVRFQARLALLKKYNMEVETAFSKYQKFQVDSRIVSSTPIAPAEQAPEGQAPATPRTP